MKNLVYVTSYPKSGSTWFRFLIYALYHRKLNISSNINAFYPSVEVNEVLLKRRVSDRGLIFAKSHRCYSPDMKFHKNIKAVICLIRNPFDCMFSKLDHIKNFSTNFNGQQEQNFKRHFVERANYPPALFGDNIHGGWNYYVNSWMNPKVPVPVYLIRYEDLLADPVRELKKVRDVLRLPFSDNRIEFASKLGRFRNIKYIERLETENKISGFTTPRHNVDKANSFVNKGKKRNGFKNLSLKEKLYALKQFQSGLIHTNYNDYLDKIPFLEQKNSIKKAN